MCAYNQIVWCNRFRPPVCNKSDNTCKTKTSVTHQVFIATCILNIFHNHQWIKMERGGTMSFTASENFDIVSLFMCSRKNKLWHVQILWFEFCWSDRPFCLRLDHRLSVLVHKLGVYSLNPFPQNRSQGWLGLIIMGWTGLWKNSKREENAVKINFIKLKCNVNLSDSAIHSKQVLRF